jgi:hypothetical protein
LTKISRLRLHCCNSGGAIRVESAAGPPRVLVIRITPAQDVFSNKGAGSTGVWRGIMDELIKALTAKVGIDEAVAQKAVGSILEFLKREAPPEPFGQLVAHIPGAEAAIAANEGGFSMMGGGLMALGSKLMGMGLGMGEIQSVARELFKYGREKIGSDAMDQIIAGTPGLSQFT